MKKPTEQTDFFTNIKGYTKKIQLYSYVVTFCKVGSWEVKAERYDGYRNKADLSSKIRKEQPDWKIKTINRLYDEDFDAPELTAATTLQEWEQMHQEEKL